MPRAIAARYDLGPPDQISWVVEDLERVLPAFTALYGSFQRIDSPLKDVFYRGQTIDCRLEVALCPCGPIEIEIIQVLEGETPHSEFLRAHGDGLHHVRFRVDALEAGIEKLKPDGFKNIFSKRFTPTLAFAYLEKSSGFGSSLIELFEARAGADA